MAKMFFASAEKAPSDLSTTEFADGSLKRAGAWSDDVNSYVAVYGAWRDANLKLSNRLPVQFGRPAPRAFPPTSRRITLL